MLVFKCPHVIWRFVKKNEWVKMCTLCKTEKKVDE